MGIDLLPLREKIHNFHKNTMSHFSCEIYAHIIQLNKKKHVKLMKAILGVLLVIFFAYFRVPLNKWAIF
jgi:hypothetical protein